MNVTVEKNAFSVRCPACQKLYTGTWSPCVLVAIRWIQCTCGVHTSLEVPHAIESIVEAVAPAPAASNLETLLRAAFAAGISYADGINEKGIETVWQMRKDELVPAVETSSLPHASAALKEFMSELGEIMSMEDGATPSDYLQRARDIRQWCSDHQGSAFKTPPEHS